MTHQAGATSSNGDALDIWHVKLANGETRALTLDQLDAAFQEGSIDERTPVLPAGAIRWSTLGEAAGLDETPPPVSSMPNSLAPIAFDATALDLRAFDASVELDADGDADVEAFRPRRGRKIFGVLTAMVVVAGLGFAAFRAKPALQHALASSGGGGSTTTNADTKPIDPPAPPATPPPATTQARPSSPSALPNVAASAAPTVADKKAAAEAEKKAAAEARKAKRTPQKRAK